MTTLRQKAEALLNSLFNYEDDDPPSKLADVKMVIAFAESVADEARAEEQELCAKLCERVHSNTGECPELALYCADAIRERGLDELHSKPEADTVMVQK